MKKFVTLVFALFAMYCFLMTIGCTEKTSDAGFAKISKQEIEKKIDEIINKMTLEEKIELTGGDGFITKPIHRLGIPSIRMVGCGLGPGPTTDGRATNYSATINMAATWDVDLIEKVGKAIGEETRGKGYDMLLGPSINIARVPHGGRAFENFTEDPYLNSRMAVAHIKGVQSKRVATCTKHYAANNQEWNRFGGDCIVDERTLREIYLPAFKAAVQEADTWSIMAAYNQVNGHYCCENKYLLTDILKDEWGFDGIALSDWGGIVSTINTAKSGLDLEMPFAKYMGEKLLEPVKNGEVEESIIDDKVRRILRVIFKLGLFNEPTVIDSSVVDTEEHRALALDVARKSIVLLKNENNLLPLNENKIKSIAVIGPNADKAWMCGYGSGALESFYKVSPLKGIKKKIGDKIVVRFERGARPILENLPPVESSALMPSNNEKSKHGLLAEYFNNRDLEGKPVLTRTDKQVNFNWKRESPAPGIVNPERFSVRWTGKLISPGTGTYELGVNADNGVRLYLDGKLLVDSWSTQDPDQLKSEYADLEANRKYDICIEFFENIGDAMAIFGMALCNDEVEIEKAVEIAKKFDVAIVCAGLTKAMEGESRDRKELALPQNQIDLINAITAVNKNTIVILYNATPILMNEWIDKVPAIIEALYPGQEGGNALADILFGDVNPSGKLPMTFPELWKDSPVYGTYHVSREISKYSEGIFVGYRHFDKYNIEPLFPFGHGLSYTTFEYSDLEISPITIDQNEIVNVKMTVKNTGKMAGDEVVQLYVQDVESSVEREVKALKGFKRLSLKPDERNVVTFELDKSSLAFYDVRTKQWVAEPGEFQVMIGSSSRNIRLKDSFELR